MEQKNNYLHSTVMSSTVLESN